MKPDSNRLDDDGLIRFRCVCGKKLKAPREHAGKPAKCSCGERPLVPDDASAHRTAAVPRPAGWYWRHPVTRKLNGPISEPAMRRLLESGVVVRSTPVRRADSDVWAPAEAWWNGFSEVPVSVEPDPDSAFVPVQWDDSSLGPPVPMQVLSPRNDASPSPGKSTKRTKVKYVKYCPSIVGSVVMFLVGLWTFFCFCAACRVVWVSLTSQHPMSNTFEALFFGLGILTFIWVVPTLLGVVIAKVCRLR